MKNTFLIVLLAFILTSCTGEKKKDLPQSFDYGTTENGTYTNDYLDLEINFPKDWVVVEGEQLKNIQEAGKEFAAGDNKELKNIIKASEVNSAQILSLFRHKMGTPVEFNQNLQVVVENLKNFPGIKSGKDYLFSAKKLLTSTAMDIEVIQDIETLDIGGKKMDGLIVTNTINNLVIKQTYLSTIKNGFCVNFVLSYINDEQQEELYDIIGSIDI